MSQISRSVAAGLVLFLGVVFVIIRSQRLVPDDAGTLTASSEDRRARDLYSHAYTPEGSQEAGAVCMDGSSPVYYLRPGWGTGAKKWFVFFEGGGWCWSEEECLDRSRMYLGSSQTYPRRLRLQDMLGNYFSASQKDNEELYNWNHPTVEKDDRSNRLFTRAIQMTELIWRASSMMQVYIKYCDGTSFSGDREEPLVVHGRRLMFRGKRIHRVVIDSLLRHRGMVDADTVIVSGCSAGALASLVQLDATKDMIVQAQAAAGRNTSALVVGLPDSGFFPDEDSAPCNYASKMKIIYDMGHMQASAHPQCLQENKGHEHRCIFAQWLLPHIQTPVFALQSSLDSWVIANVQCEDYNRHAKGHRLLQPHGLEHLKDRFSKSFWSAHKGAALLDTCHHHCHLQPGHVILKAWTGLKAKGMSQQKAFLQWLKDVDSGRFQPGKGRWEQEGLGSCPQ